MATRPLSCEPRSQFLNDAFQRRLLVPQDDRLGAGPLEGVDRVPVAIRPREDDDADADGHQAGSPASDEAPAIDSMA